MKHNYTGIFRAIPVELALSGIRDRSPYVCWFVARNNGHTRYALLQGKSVRYELEPEPGCWGQMAVEIWPEALDMFLRMFSEQRPGLVKVDAFDSDLTISPYVPDTTSAWFTPAR
ncbi:hypothetical protein [Nonomuraea zeae]|uniref:hypothetical protein n=1 Tax=Nonomuraea zeae TaxID=1642303 RepID=UPI00360FCBF2